MPQSNAFVEHQHLIRGAIGARRRRGFFQSPVHTPAHQYRTAVRKAFIHARAALDSTEYAEFLTWYDGLRIAEFGTRKESNVGFDYLNGVIDGPPISLAKELSWIAARLLTDADILREFRQSVRTIEMMCTRGRLREALDTLSTVVHSHGESMWSVQLRLALEQRQGGLEPQKSYLQFVRSQFQRGILSYVAYNTSLRNEDRTSWQRFSTSIRSASSKRRDRAVADYLNFRLLNEWPETTSGIENVLRIEQSHSIADLYETFVGFCQLSHTRDTLKPYRPLLQAVAEALSLIDDFRLLHLTGAPSLKPRGEESAAELAKGDLPEVLRKARKASLVYEDPWTAIYVAIARSSGGRVVKNTHGLFSDALAKFFSVRGAAAQDAHDLEKLCHNFSGLPFARALTSFIDASIGSNGLATFDFARVGLNSAFSGKEEQIGLQVLLKKESLVKSVPPLSTALEKYSAGDFKAAVENLRIVLRFPPADWFERLSCFLWLHCADALGDLEDVVSSISRLGSSDPSIVALLPIKHMLGDRGPKDFGALKNELAVLNALNMLWKRGEDDRIASALKLLTGRYLRSSPQRRPSLLSQPDTDRDTAELVYFLREVCVPNVLDVSRVFAGSREVLEERQAICSVLNIIDPAHAEDYSTEVTAITRRLKVDEGLKIVDQSRIHVDTDAVSRWARKNLSEDFDRYTDLLAAGIGAKGSFDEALREVREAIKNARQAEFFTPQNEADNALVALLGALREEFLNSATSGLDYFLSKRIRHVSFIGLVRGPLEFSHLIANKPTENSDYRSNSFWLNKLNTLHQETRAKVDAAQKSFSKQFDDQINRLKDQSLQIRSSEHPTGVFDIPLNATLLTLARALLTETDSFDQFLEVVYVIFWASLETSLSQARRIIDDDLKMGLAHLMDELKGEIGAYAWGRPGTSRIKCRACSSEQRCSSIANRDGKLVYPAGDTRGQTLFHLGRGVGSRHRVRLEAASRIYT